MSSWVDNQRQEAFLLWRRYLAMGLHFKPGSGFDYGLYSGATNATPAGFSRRPKEEIAKFIRLKNRLKSKGWSDDEFLFANARYENLYVDKLLHDDAMWLYKEWKEVWGSEEAFEGSVKHLLEKIDTGCFGSVGEIVRSALSHNDQKWYELIAWLLQKNSNDVTGVRMEVEGNELFKIHLNRSIKIQKLYSYLCII